MTLILGGRCEALTLTPGSGCEVVFELVFGILSMAIGVCESCVTGVVVLVDAIVVVFVVCILLDGVSVGVLVVGVVVLSGVVTGVVTEIDDVVVSGSIPTAPCTSTDISCIVVCPDVVSDGDIFVTIV